LIQFYSNIQLTPSGYGPGENYLGSAQVTTDGNGNASFRFNSPVVVPVGQFITATATSYFVDTSGQLTAPALFDTSEFSAGLVVGNTPIAIGTLQFDQPSYSVNETDGSITVTIQRTGGSAGTITATFQTANRTATAADGDYTPVSMPLTFGPGVTSATVTVPISVDQNAEGDETLSLVLGNIAGADSSNQVVANLTIIDNDRPTTVPVSGPKVANVQVFGTRGQAKTVVLTFNEALDPARAANLGNYRLVTPGRDRRFGTRDDQTIPLRTPVYSPAAHTVTLTPRRKLPTSGQLQLTVIGTGPGGVADLAENLLNGNGDGHTPGNFVRIINPRTLARPALIVQRSLSRPGPR
jgi:hypothetical protein